MARSAAGKLFQTHGPATANDLSPSRVLVLGTVQVTEAAECSRRVSSLTKFVTITVTVIIIASHTVPITLQRCSSPHCNATIIAACF